MTDALKVPEGPQALAALHSAAFLWPRPWSAAEFAALLARNGAKLYTAPGAFLLGQILAGEGEVLTLATHPAARRQGRAEALLAAFIAEAKAEGAARLVLEVATSNSAAQALYRKAGFAEIARRLRYYPKPETLGGGAEDACLFALELRLPAKSGG